MIPDSLIQYTRFSFTRTLENSLWRKAPVNWEQISSFAIKINQLETEGKTVMALSQGKIFSHSQSKLILLFSVACRVFPQNLDFVIS